jgi:hypothetical protein
MASTPSRRAITDCCVWTKSANCCCASPACFLVIQINIAELGIIELSDLSSSYAMLVNSFQSIQALILNTQNEITSEILARSQQHIGSELISTQAIKNISLRLEKIEKILQTQRYNLAFIGQVGTGKTTAICHLFGLIQEIKKTVGTKEKSVTKYQELLTTGSGKTTICEVVIRPAFHTFIEIDPYEHDEIYQLIDDFGLWVWQKVHPEGSKKKVEIPPNELLRAIRNIVALPEVMQEGKLVDQAVQFAKEFVADNYQSFKAALVDRGQLGLRSATRIEAESTEPDIAQWVGKTFQAINVAKLPNFSIPKRIYLNLESSILDFSKYPNIGGIVDTRGLDLGTKDRRDLNKYIRDDDNTICIFVDRFSSAPGNTIDIISKYLTPTSEYIDSKFSLLVVPRKGEPEKILGGDGIQVGTVYEGIALRRANIDNVFTNEGVDFISENIIFYDALRCYLDDSTMHPYYDKSDITSDRDRILAEISNLINNRERKLTEEVYTLINQFYLIQQAEYPNEQENHLVAEVKKKLNPLDKLLPIANDFTEDYINSLAVLHHMVLRATNNRYGKYELRGVDIYFSGRSLAENFARLQTKNLKLEIINSIVLAQTKIVSSSQMWISLQRLHSQISENYEALVIELGQKIENILATVTLAPQSYEDSEFWQEVINRWGQGSGYKQDVLSCYNSQIKSIETTLINLIVTGWQEDFIKPALIFLGNSDKSESLSNF